MEQVTFGKGRSTVAFGAIDRGAPDDPYSGGHFALEVRGDGVSASARVVMLGSVQVNSSEPAGLNGRRFGITGHFGTMCDLAHPRFPSWLGRTTGSRGDGRGDSAVLRHPRLNGGLRLLAFLLFFDFEGVLGDTVEGGDGGLNVAWPAGADLG